LKFRRYLQSRGTQGEMVTGLVAVLAVATPPSAFTGRLIDRGRPQAPLYVYTHLFDEARHARDIRTLMAASPFAGLLESTGTAPLCSNCGSGREGAHPLGIAPLR
jgi:hypothetical protein